MCHALLATSCSVRGVFCFALLSNKRVHLHTHQATYQEALEFFESAERTDPGFWMMNRVMIANTHEKLGNKEKALEWARKALLLPARSLDDKDAKQQAEALVKKLGGK